MNLYIEIENNVPINHPAFEFNLLQAFGIVPENWKPFKRIIRPTLDVYEVLVNPDSEYKLIDGYYQDVWVVRQMTLEEVETKKLQAINEWDNFYPSWVFSETKCVFEPPIAYPQDGKQYQWDESIINWVEVNHEQVA